MTKSETNKHALRNNLILLAIVVVIFGVWILISNITKPTPQPSMGTNNIDKSTEEVSQGDMETFCQDSNLIGKYMSLKDIAVVSASDYNAYFQSYNSDSGEKIYFLRWNGKDKDGKKLIQFTCYASGTKDNLTLKYLSMDNTALFGTLDS